MSKLVSPGQWLAVATGLATLACLSACSPGSPIPAGSPSTSSVPLTPLSFLCNLPTAASNAPADGNPHDGVVGVGGFVTFPSAIFKRDPMSMTTFMSGRWWPVPRSWISPDGSKYSYVLNNPDAVIHVVNTFSSVDTAIAPRSSVASGARINIGGAKTILAFEKEGIYLESVILNSDRAPFGLALLDPTTGNYQDLFNGQAAQFIAVHNGYAYFGEGALGADKIPVLGPPPYWNELAVVRLDGSSIGSQSGGAYMPDSWLRIVGFDGGDQPIMSAQSATSYRIYTGAMFSQSVFPVFVGRTGDPDNPIGPVVADGRGIWFGSASGVIWYYPGGGAAFERVAIAPFHPVHPAGPCQR